MVKKTVFPLETLVLSVVLAAVVNEVIAFAIYAVYVALARPSLALAWLLLAVPALAAADPADVRASAASPRRSTAFLRDTAHAVGDRR